MAKIRAVYPQIDSTSDLMETTVGRLMQSQNVKNLGSPIIFNDTTPEELYTNIRSYVTSVPGTKSQLWPLVKVCQLYLKAEILEHGLVMVDIPGSMDSNAARCSQAESYQKNIAAHLILTPPARAASARETEFNLDKTFQLKIDLNGYLNSENIAVIIARIDESLKVHRYMQMNPEIRPGLAHLLQTEASHLQLKSTTLKEINDLNSIVVDRVAAIKKLTSDIQPLWGALKAVAKGSSIFFRGETNLDLKLAKAILAINGLSKELVGYAQDFHLFIDARETLRKQKNNAVSKMNRKEKKVKLLDSKFRLMECEKTRACIKYRAQKQTAGIRKSFEDMTARKAKKGTVMTTTPLQVYPVSAEQFLRLQDGEAPSLGFPRKVDTGIPQLRKGLENFTLKTRHQNAILGLEEVEKIIHGLRAWVVNTDSIHQISQEERRKLEVLFEKLILRLLEEFAKLHTKVTRDVEKAISKVFEHAAHFEAKAALKAQRIVVEFASHPHRVAVHVGTYAATVRRHGIYQPSKMKEAGSINWNDDLAYPYLSALTSRELQHLWAKCFDDHIPEIYNQCSAAAKSLLLGFSKELNDLGKAFCPTLAEQFQSLQESIDLAEHILKEQYAVTFQRQIPCARRAAHSIVGSQIQIFMTKAYDACSAERKKGAFKRMKEIMNKFIKANALKMYQKCTSTLQNHFRQTIKKLPVILGKAPTNLVGDTRRIFKLLLDNHTQASSSRNKQGNLSQKKKRMCDDITAELDKIVCIWCEKLKPPSEEQKEPLETYELSAEELAKVDPDESDDDKWLDDDEDGHAMDVDA